MVLPALAREGFFYFPTKDEIMMQENPRIGHLAKTFADRELPLEVLRSAAGYYLGTWDEEGPFTRESQEYFSNERAAWDALARGDWTQRKSL